MKKGIVMEVDDAFLTLLTPEGEFCRTKKQDYPYTIGEEIYFFPMESGNSTKTSFSLRNAFKLKAVWIVMAVLLIGVGSLIPSFQNNTAYAYMSIDANPSIEIGVNKKMQVVELTGFNEDGKRIISDLPDWKKKDVSQLAKSILVKMKNAGFIRNNEPVIISTVRAEQPKEKAEKAFKKNMSKIKETVNNQQLDVKVLTGSQKEREKAQELGISTGTYQEKMSQSSSQKKRPKSIVKEKGQEQKAQTSEREKITPPGQLKKQTEANAVQDLGVTRETPKDKTLHSEGKPIPPGQLKKQDEERWKQDQGQSKRQEQSKKPEQQREKPQPQNRGNQQHSVSNSPHQKDHKK
ncbi:anti-sigma factor domain-containing protein [Neobacillus sp. OS1-2]|uniref:anti-sigma factor domain-containing protein n=1 Tax=Neobacillus sp. OS1-2 TaxID=3070680 RepID=UPI0027E1CF1D|nr:anti-sigma factor domain-containing protein [Neobacillus sp. OS1-2]WML38878.1 anti-sigma factor domain-containing protein [Neobacillus sp. OS1-2]